jgi:hypothetical protein
MPFDGGRERRWERERARPGWEGPRKVWSVEGARPADGGSRARQTGDEAKPTGRQGFTDSDFFEW